MATRMLVSTASGANHIRHLTNTTSNRGYQECGLSGKVGGDATGLATSSTYYFKVNHNLTGVTEKSITTALDVTFTAVIALMNAQMTGLLTGVTWSLTGGDLRCTSVMFGTASSVALSAGTTGTNLFTTLTGFTAFDTAVAGTGPSEDPTGIGIIPSSGTSCPYAVGVGGSIRGGHVVAHIFGDGGTVTGSPALEGAASGSGPWVVIQTVTDPTAAGTLVPVPFGSAAIRLVRINAGVVSGNLLRATLSANFANGAAMW